MKKLTKLLLILVLGSLMFSCSNDEFDNSRETPLSQLRNIEFIYNGITYTSAYTINEDSILVFDNQDVAKIYEEISAFPDLCTYIHPNGVEEYFENAIAALQNKKIVNENQQLMPNLRVSNVEGLVNFYEHSNKQGRILFFRFGNEGIQIPDLRVHKFNDMISSFFATTVDGSYREGTVEFYADLNYTGKSLILGFTLMKDYARYICEHSNLSDFVIRKPGLFNHSVSWNDYATSLKIRFF